MMFALQIARLAKNQLMDDILIGYDKKSIKSDKFSAGVWYSTWMINDRGNTFPRRFSDTP